MSKHGGFSHHVPLFLFTSLMIFAAGITLGSAVDHLFHFGYFLPGLSGYAVAALAFFGLTASFMHLGRKERAFRTAAGLLRSWLSIEAALAGAFTGVVVLAATGLELPGIWLLPWAALGLSILLPLSISMLYKLGSQESWKDICELIRPLLMTLYLAMAFLAHNTVEDGHGIAFWVLATLDLANFVNLTIKRNKNIKRVQHMEFPELGKALVPLSVVRVSAILTGLVLAFLGYFHYFIPCFGIALVIDRFLFYALALKKSPGNDLKQIKDDRMREALK